jgi:hypothetical protein
MPIYLGSLKKMRIDTTSAANKIFRLSRWSASESQQLIVVRGSQASSIPVAHDK